ncbi:MAG TPA: alpha/beta hydrolase [Balneolaceae bacterium]|nr:alpha/beta hydrolase [Balneolaceae bacterium]
MKQLVLSILLIFYLPFNVLSQESLKGDWRGFITINGTNLTILTHFSRSGSGFVGTIDIPQQMAQGIQLLHIQSTPNDSVFFEFQAGMGMASFNGKFKNTSQIEGDFHQNGMTFPFQLNRQEENTSHSYRNVDPIFTNKDHKIAGTLTYPNQKDSFYPCIILLSGSGAQTRDEDILGFPIFKRIAHYLADHGTATFRFDDRGTGQSTGSISDATLADLTTDVRVIVDSLKERKFVDSKRIGLLGHSQGGIIGSKLAAEDSAIRFLILMASPALPLSEITIDQVRSFSKAQGDTDSTTALKVAMEEHIFETLRENQNLDSLKNQLVDYTVTELQKLPDGQKNKIGDLKSFANRQVSSQLKQMRTPFYRSIMDYNPASDLKKLHIPVLLLFGGKDMQVLAVPNQSRARHTLTQSDADYKIVTITSANHLFQHAQTGMPGEYGSLDAAFTEDFLPTLSRWLESHAFK